MDTKQQFSHLKYTKQTVPQTQLWIGQHELLVENAQNFLQTLFCTNGVCKKCTTCMQIKNKQYHAVRWLHPNKQYTVDQLHDLFTTITFQLQPNELFFFIIQKADFLTPLCSNKLLKPIEEPPCGYHFILLAERPENILPTIRSRCIVHTFQKTNSYVIQHPLFNCFTTQPLELFEFSQLLDKTPINERESIELLDEIMNYWITRYKETIGNHQKHKTIKDIISVLEKMHIQPPMPGSSKLFWRNAYLQLKNIVNTNLI